MDPEAIRIERSKIEPVGQLVEVSWKSGCPMSELQDNQSVFVVRGMEEGMLFLSLVYNAATGVHQGDATFFVNCASVDYLRVLSEHDALVKIKALELKFAEEHPRD